MNKILIAIIAFTATWIAHSWETVRPSSQESFGAFPISQTSEVGVKRQGLNSAPPDLPSSELRLMETVSPENDFVEETQRPAPQESLISDGHIPFSPYKAAITAQDSPLGRTPKSFKQIKSLPLLKHFDSSPSLRFLSGNFMGAYQRNSNLYVIRLALFFKDNNLDEMSPISCGGILQRTPSTQSLSGNIQDQTTEFFSMDGKTENQRSLLIVIKNQIVIHAWQLDKREKTLWAKVYLVQKGGDLLELGYAQLEQVKETFKSCLSIN